MPWTETRMSKKERAMKKDYFCLENLNIILLSQLFMLRHSRIFCVFPNDPLSWYHARSVKTSKFIIA